MRFYGSMKILWWVCIFNEWVVNCMGVCTSMSRFVDCMGFVDSMSGFYSGLLIVWGVVGSVRVFLAQAHTLCFNIYKVTSANM
jgi:hypothetical protein